MDTRPYCHEWSDGRLCTLRQGHIGRHLDTVLGGDGWETRPWGDVYSEDEPHHPYA